MPPEIVQQLNGDVVVRIQGVEWTLKPDGTVVQKSRDGDKITFYPDGRTVTVTREGRVYQENPGGSTNTTQPDGTVIKGSPGGQRTVKGFIEPRLGVWAEGLSDDEIRRLLEEQREREEAERVRIIELNEKVRRGDATKEDEMDLASYEARQRAKEEGKKEQAERGYADESQPGSGPRKVERLPRRGDGQNIGYDQ